MNIAEELRLQSELKVQSKSPLKTDHVEVLSSELAEYEKNSS